MTEDTERPTPQPEPQPPEEWRARPSAPASTAEAPDSPSAYPPVYMPGYPPPPDYGQPGVYPPPPDYYYQPGYGAGAGQPPVYPPPPEYYAQGGQAPAYTPGYPPDYPPGFGPYPPYPPYPPQQPYPFYPQAYGPRPAPPQAMVEAPVEVDGRLHLFWPIVSAAVSFAVYALLLGWQFGLGFMALLLVHEMGHFVVIRAKGMPAGLPIFIPLLGAFVTMRRAPASVRDEAEIALAGPLAGTVGGVICLIAYWRTGAPVLLPLAYFSFYLNLLNLIPVGPLDGARVTAAISKWIWPLGLIGVAVGVWYTHDILLIALAIFGVYLLFSRFREAGRTSYYTISPGARVFITLLYFGLAGILAYATFSLQPLMATRGGFF